MILDGRSNNVETMGLEGKTALAKETSFQNK